MEAIAVALHLAQAELDLTFRCTVTLMSEVAAAGYVEKPEVAVTTPDGFVMRLFLSPDGMTAVAILSLAEHMACLTGVGTA